MTTKIEWCDETINPIVGCSKISEGCRNCYAEKMAWRLKCMGIPKYQNVVDRDGWTEKIGTDMSVFDRLPQKPSKIFIGSMGDIFFERVFLSEIYEVLDKIKLNKDHTFMILTKRRFDKLLKLYESAPRFIGIPNLWLGVTAENQRRADERIPVLLQIPAAVRFVSVEPMLGPVDLSPFFPLLECGECGKHCAFENETCPNCGASDESLMDNELRSTLDDYHYGPSVDWVIAGPETGPGARPCDPKWIEDLYEQCKAAGVPFFDKRKTGWLAREFPK